MTKRSASFMNKKWISLMILFSVILGCASCGNDEGNPGKGTDSQNPDASVSGSKTDATEKINLESSGVEIKDFGGAEFVVLSNNVPNHAHTWKMFDPDELNADAMNDAMYNRNKKIEAKYNIEISVVYSSDLKTDLTKSINSQENTYSTAFGSMNTLYKLAREGMLLNFFDMTKLDTSAEWWDQSLVEGLTYKNKLYTLTGDISPALNSRVFTLVFNKDLCASLGLELPYQYVLDGTWTIDRFNKYISDVNLDLNGDSQMDFEDRWGFLSEEGCAYMMYFSGGGEVTTMNKSGELEISFNSERNVELAAKALRVATDSSKTLMANPYAKQNNDDWSTVTNWFAGGGALFRSTALEPVPRDLRSLDVNFGIVPFPKLDEAQKRYYTLPAVDAMVFSVPVSADPEFAGLILEALSAESVSTVSPAFYDLCLDGKAVRDDESMDMLDIIFDSKRFDFGLINGIGNVTGRLIELEKKGQTDIASSNASALESAATELSKLNDQLSTQD